MNKREVVKTWTGLKNLWHREFIDTISRADELKIKVNVWWDRCGRMHLFAPSDEKRIYKK